MSRSHPTTRTGESGTDKISTTAVTVRSTQTLGAPGYLLWCGISIRGDSTVAIEAPPTGRSPRRARPDLLDSVADLLLLTGLLLYMKAGEHWLWLSPTGLALLPLVYAAKRLRLFRARRRTAACPPIASIAQPHARLTPRPDPAARPRPSGQQRNPYLYTQGDSVNPTR